MSHPSVCFAIEKVIGVSTDGNIRSYQVQWAPVWVSDVYLVGCEHLIDEFLKTQLTKNTDTATTTTSSELITKPVAKTTLATTITATQTKGDDISELDTELDDFEPLPTQVCIESATDALSLGLSDTNVEEYGNQTFSHYSTTPPNRSNSRGNMDNYAEIPVKIELEYTDDNLSRTADVYHGQVLDSENDTEETMLVDKDRSLRHQPYVDDDIGQANLSLETEQSSIEYNNTLDSSDNFMLSLPDGTYQCSFCTKVWRTVSELRRHLRTHTGAKPFKCTVCLKAFAWKRCLKRHMSLHTGIKPFQCEFCFRRYPDRSSLNQHIRAICKVAKDNPKQETPSSNT